MLKKIFVILVLFTLSTTAQFDKLRSNQGFFGSGFGISWIDDEPHYTFQLFPEFAFANFGIGLDLNLEFDSKGKLRNENFNEFSDFISIIRYVRYGRKKDPVHIRIGALDYSTLGHGSIMYLYNNRPSYDSRKNGLEFDIDFTTFGFESVYGSFGEAGVAGLRAFVRPIKMTSLGNVPIIGGLEFGATYVRDFNKYAGVLDGNKDIETGELNATIDDGNVTVVGLDIGFPIIKSGVFGFDVYFDYAKILDFGEGTALGGIISLNGLGLVDVRAKMERRYNGDNYLPSYFNSFYELDRFQFDEKNERVKSKIQQLKSIESIGNGYYGELLIRVLGTFDILGSYQRLDDHPNSGIFHASTEIAPKGLPFVARAGYDKINIKDEKDLFTLDDRSYLFAELGYKPYPYILVSMVYNWTFTPTRDAGDKIIGYKPQKKIEPRVSFIYPFDLR